MAQEEFHIMILFGTRPEAIKLAPLIRLLQQKIEKEGFPWRLTVCNTSQHRELLANALDFFRVPVDVHLNVMKPDQSLHYLTGAILQRLEEVLQSLRPDLLIVQGDTTSTLAGALAGFYSRIPVLHVEAGLRTGRLDQPYPEELNRLLVDQIATIRCAPSVRAWQNLVQENLQENLWLTGNTGIDALVECIRYLRSHSVDWAHVDPRLKSVQQSQRPLVVMTAHRRENFGEAIRNVFRAVDGLTRKFPDVLWVFPVHLNPNVRQAVDEVWKGEVPENLVLLEPVPYHFLVELLTRASLVVTDSGGIQEECAYLGKPVLITRLTTERPEVVEEGPGFLVGTDPGKIEEVASWLLSEEAEYQKVARPCYVYGRGDASRKILEGLQKWWEEKKLGR